MRRIRLSRALIERMGEIGEKAYPAEGCAVFLGNPESFEIKEIKVMKNYAPGDFSGVFFRIDPKELLSIENDMGENDEITGFFHTHPDCGAVLSKEDEEYMIPGLLYIVMSVDGGSFSELRAYVKDPGSGVTEDYMIIKGQERRYEYLIHEKAK